jgi:hypothetical protein
MRVLVMVKMGRRWRICHAYGQTEAIVTKCCGCNAIENRPTIGGRFEISRNMCPGSDLRNFPNATRRNPPSANH